MSETHSPQPGELSEEAVRGERTTAIVDAARSAQSRVSGLLAAGLMITLGLSALGWYYAHALTRVTRARQQAQTATTSRAQGEMSLPSLGHIEPPMAVAASTSAPTPPERPLEPGPIANPREPVGVVLGAPGHPTDDHATPPSRAELALARRLAGGVLARGSDSEAQHAILTQPSQTPPVPTLAAGPAGPDAGSGVPRGSDHGEGSFAALLHAEVSPAEPASLLPTQRLLLPQGSFIDCTLETAIDSTLPGMTTCITAADTFGADGKVVLLERGTKLVGETRGQVRQGQARVFVLWTQARTPTGVVVPLASPGTDELGRAGLAGEVDRHFWQRFGAAMMITLIDGAVQAGVQASARNGGTVIYAPSSSQDVLTEVLKDTAAIPPTVIKRNGDRIQVLVARDLDFRTVYELHATAAGP
jgi:type IV secretion system protein VirB10